VRELLRRAVHCVCLYQPLPKTGCCSFAEYAAHCVNAYNRRVRQMDTDLPRLALFLNPRFRTAANSSDRFNGLLFQVLCSGSGSRVGTAVLLCLLVAG